MMPSKIIALLSLLFVATAGCRNMYEETAKKTTDDAVFYQAKMSLNKRDYTSAINLMETMSAGYLAQRPVNLVYASAYSGRCGLEFVNFLTDLENVGSANSMFSFLMQEFPGGTDAKISDCDTSESHIDSFGTLPSQRSSDENILMGLTNLTEIGTILSRYADTDGDGSADAGFDMCSTTDIPDAKIAQIGVGMAEAILSITAVAASISSGTLQEITNLCSADPNLNAFCTTTDPNAYSANELKALRSILNSSTQGIGSCTGSFIACACP